MANDTIDVTEEIQFLRGEDITITLGISEDDGTPIDITDWTLSLSGIARINDTENIFDCEGTITDAANGLASFEITTDQTNELTTLNDDDRINGYWGITAITDDNITKKYRGKLIIFMSVD